ncbi:TetR/AcrR family transcriptional regulator [Allonocardiopsis opalescens]|uniref:TetR family transcriptional regulator n=1 Tax=Allonocardiopsis opalescens TaxID=1144618 RepID=A0A2T0QDR8_9ACTN|nr:TetR/AcrR family transcriptional regulator [Allonocardiopsis opalescens]PRY01993.1 TetR family transcriptional regulator [Allonocardiopsis opalescens]
MAGRPRTISDERLLAAVASAVGRVGVARLTLAEIARDAGVTTGALVQRFGSKRELLLAHARSASVWSPLEARAAFATAPDPVEGIVRAVVLSVDADRSPQEFANHLGWLGLELADDEFRELLARQGERVREQLAEFLREAAEQGRLRLGGEDEVLELAELLDTVRHGAQISWAVAREGRVAETVRRRLETVLAPYRTPPG